jgi:hypothetical protein
VSTRTGAYRFSWVGRPHSKPTIAVEGDTLYVSWNGATEVRSWQLLGGPEKKRLRPLLAVPKTGFEAAIPLPADVPGSRSARSTGSAAHSPAPRRWVGHEARRPVCGARARARRLQRQEREGVEAICTGEACSRASAAARADAALPFGVPTCIRRS